MTISFSKVGSDPFLCSVLQRRPLLLHRSALSDRAVLDRAENGVEYEDPSLQGMALHRRPANLLHFFREAGFAT